MANTFLTVPEFSKASGFSTYKLYRMINAGEIEHAEFRGQTLICSSALPSNDRGFLLFSDEEKAELRKVYDPASSHAAIRSHPVTKLLNELEMMAG